MSRQAFISWNPRGESLALVQRAVEICEDYRAQGYDLTLRQLYYQFVAKGLIPNNQRSYKNLGGVIDKGRMAGLIDWNYIVDRTRNVYRTDGTDESPEEALQTTAGGYAKQLWRNQPWHVEVWVEKEALVGVIQQAANQVGVNYFACRGYVSQSEMYSAGQRFRRHRRAGKQCLVIHLGDHDPSGIDMTRDIEDRLHQFSGRWDNPEVRRVALNMAQVEEYQPPPNPAKLTDSRVEGYIAEYGEESWELDALDPSQLTALIVDNVMSVRDEALWDEDYQQQEAEREQLQGVATNWDTIIAQGLDRE